MGFLETWKIFGIPPGMGPGVQITVSYISQARGPQILDISKKTHQREKHSSDREERIKGGDMSKKER